MITVIGNGGLDVYDNHDGSLLLAWGEMLNPTADSYNVYVNGTLVANVLGLQYDWVLESGLGYWQLESGAGRWALEGAGVVGNYLATPAGLATASYNPAARVSAAGTAARPQNMPGAPGVATPAGTYSLNVVAVAAGAEVCSSHHRTITPGPASIALVTPMRRIWPFPNTGID